ncbi:Rdx family-domain-containing protein [Xylaria intraflava]|nr:Rdx family-domain-containing protein [Xylaria intraflava]
MTDSLPSTISGQSPASAQTTSSSPLPLPLPRVAIRFCTQCKWMLRAAYFAQELLSTFSTSLGEVALQPATGGIFVVEIYHSDPSVQPTASSDPTPTIQRRVLWDRKKDGGFPETKELKRRVRDVIEPDRNLGHVDRDYPRQQKQTPEGETVKPLDGGGSKPLVQDHPSQTQPPPQKNQAYCEDCQ